MFIHYIPVLCTHAGCSAVNIDIIQREFSKKSNLYGIEHFNYVVALQLSSINKPTIQISKTFLKLFSISCKIATRQNTSSLSGASEISSLSLRLTYLFSKNKSRLLRNLRPFSESCSKWLNLSF